MGEKKAKRQRLRQRHRIRLIAPHRFNRRRKTPKMAVNCVITAAAGRSSASLFGSIIIADWSRTGKIAKPTFPACYNSAVWSSTYDTHEEYRVRAAMLVEKQPEKKVQRKGGERLRLSGLLAPARGRIEVSASAIQRFAGRALRLLRAKARPSGSGLAWRVCAAMAAKGCGGAKQTARCVSRLSDQSSRCRAAARLKVQERSPMSCPTKTALQYFRLVSNRRCSD